MVETSIIIPTLNEENYLPKLLKSIKNQGYKDYEVIVTDNNSKDKTRQIARTYGCKVVNGGLPAKARNNGVKIAKGSYFLFIDADVVLPKDCLKQSLKQFKEQKLDIGVVRFKPLGGDFRDVLLHWLYFSLAYMLHKIEPYTNTGYMLCKKEIFNKVKGFDESLMVGEDTDFGRRAKLNGANTGFLKNVYVDLSVRRFKVEGRIYLFFKYLAIAFYRALVSEIKRGNKIFSYNWKYREKI